MYGPGADPRRTSTAKAAIGAPDVAIYNASFRTRGAFIDLVPADVERAIAVTTFIVDPDNIIQHVTVNGLNVGRNPQETLRILDALQTDELCPCNWTEGQDVLKPVAA